LVRCRPKPSRTPNRPVATDATYYGTRYFSFIDRNLRTEGYNKRTPHPKGAPSAAASRAGQDGDVVDFFPMGHISRVGLGRRGGAGMTPTVWDRARADLAHLVPDLLRAEVVVGAPPLLSLSTSLPWCSLGPRGVGVRWDPISGEGRTWPRRPWCARCWPTSAASTTRLLWRQPARVGVW
jgi:hypothetical protein